MPALSPFSKSPPTILKTHSKKTSPIQGAVAKLANVVGNGVIGNLAYALVSNNADAAFNAALQFEQAVLHYLHYATALFKAAPPEEFNRVQLRLLTILPELQEENDTQLSAEQEAVRQEAIAFIRSRLPFIPGEETS